MITEAQMLERFERVRRQRDGSWLVTCPAHDDRTPSLHVTLKDRWLLDCKAGCKFDDVVAELGIDKRELFAENGNRRREVVDTYDYTDENDELLYQVVRFAPKDFRQRRPDGNGGWIWSLNGTRRVPYRLPRVLKAAAVGDGVFVPEGEKDVAALERAGVTATCNPGGAGKWRAEYAEHLRGAQAVVVADRDEAGYAHARQVAESLQGIAATVDVVEPAAGKDVSDHLAAGKSIGELVFVEDRFSPSSPTLGNGKNGKKVEESVSGSTEPNIPFAAPMSEKLAGVPPDPKWTWDGYLAPGAITLLAGRPKVGKTTLLFPLIAALEQGRPFLDRGTVPTRVLMLSEEREQTLAEKRQLYLNGSDPALLMRHEQNGRSWPELIEQARVYCAEHEIGVLVIDTWDKWTGLRGDDESKAGAVIEALEPLMLAAGDGLAVLIIAHQRKAAGKHGEAVRGSNAITGGVDVIVELERTPEELGRRMRVLRAESRFTATPEELVGELTEDGGYVAQGELDEVKREAEGKATAALVTTAPGATIKELAESSEIPSTTMDRRLHAALEDGYVSRTGAGRKGDPYRWHPVGEEMDR